LVERRYGEKKLFFLWFLKRKGDKGRVYQRKQCLIVLKLQNKVVGGGGGGVLGEPKQKMYLKVEVKIWGFEVCGIYTK
jgi:hypothetical protein